ncbi:hypothetical protein CHGG_10007 [Chaetomium globosum CBS 148.51]|uniref:Uncharacterized protein n=1 Tax=Chaetomium globosum (strain ATCC 6205 / CBS 148.51 / DSM 1962 / NBRC 6347 / NRRL 1970) TaxID=306901 RepID=Q2GPU7_CHAGB|nr:uncharacterized protein CHGG_10007 [Chaetomium globosum CBS 148.51]EAQ83603.1 hypothetical protein CHGG_10007 [Chaetomium globosum CBS 148.51]
MTSEATSESLTQTGRPFQNVLQLWKGRIPLPSFSLGEHSYGFGWAGAQLPGILAPGDNGPDDLNPMVGIGAPPKLAVYHGGDIAGFSTYNALFPASGSAVVVLTNSLLRNNGVRWIGELLIEALFNNSHNAQDYQVVAKKAAESAVQRFQDTSKSLAAGRTVEQPNRPLNAYIGDYHNLGGNFFIQVRFNEKRDGLLIAYMGREADTFELVPYQADSFYWTLTYDDTVKLGREVVYPEEYYIVKFGLAIEEPGEMFKKAGGSAVVEMWEDLEVNLVPT